MGPQLLPPTPEVIRCPGSPELQAGDRVPQRPRDIQTQGPSMEPGGLCVQALSLLASSPPLWLLLELY